LPVIRQESAQNRGIPFHVIHAFVWRRFSPVILEEAAKGGDRKEAIFHAAAMIGGVILARAVQDPRLSDEILSSVRQKLR
jgi:hypothetical protein